MISKRFYIFLLLFAVLVGCNVTTKQPLSNSLKRKWMLVAMEDFSRDTLVKYATYIDLTSSDNAGSAYMGCNTIGFRYEIYSKDKIKFSDFISTKMYCQQTGKIEDEFSRLIVTMNGFSTQNAHKLVLVNEEGKQLQFVAADWD
ncbi:META domain-containing protein [Flavobacterium sp. H122]|uniref:META domain-containing protein n=1 Tax=Flavobacterium sp. H122 TaxID=2529860 RepID=UPI0010AA4403|nr:META domain-containing protein [Flavobacterium sp. H122]